jgi:hypothetical protein
VELEKSPKPRPGHPVVPKGIARLQWDHHGGWMAELVRSRRSLGLGTPGRIFSNALFFRVAIRCIRNRLPMDAGSARFTATLRSADIDAWLGPDSGSNKLSAGPTEEEKGLIGELYETSEMKVGAFGFKIDLKPIFRRVWRHLHLRR